MPTTPNVKVERPLSVRTGAGVRTFGGVGPWILRFESGLGSEALRTQPSSPLLRVTGGVEHGQDLDVVGVLHEQHDVWEPPDDRLPDPAFYPPVGLRVALHQRERDLDAPEQLVPEPLSPFLVPVPGLVQLAGGLRADPKKEAPLRRRTCSRATSQGMEVSG